jgi:hypothetical protein
MDVATIKDWLLPVSSSFALISTGVGIWIAVRDLGLKFKAEARLSQSAQVEADVQLLKLFTEIMNLAHARGSTLVSEKAVEFLLKDKSLADMTKDGVKVKVGDMIRDSATFALPVAVEAQDAAIAAIATLGKQHEILRPAALQALESLMLVKKKVVEKHLSEFKREAKVGA